MNFIQKLKDPFLSQVADLFPFDFLSQSSEDLLLYGKDWTRVYVPNPSAIAFPRTTEEVSQFLKLCSDHQVAVVPSGGRTGLAGGAVAVQGEIVLSLRRMNRLDAVDELAQTVRVQAGCVTEAVHQHTGLHGLTWPVDFASKGSSQVGGNISTNAGGVKVIRYGLTRQWVLGLQVVTMKGEILELNGALEKNNTGLDLRQLFIGSEGTLGIITEATLKLTRTPGELDVFFFAVDGIPKVLELFQEVRKASFSIMAFEFLTKNCLNLVTQMRGLKAPFSRDYSAYVLIEIERNRALNTESGGKNFEDQMESWLATLFEKELVLDGTLAQSPRDARDLWSLREGISESLSMKGRVHKNDIALPVSGLKNFIEEMNLLFSRRQLGLEVFLFGHIGDGNLHVNTMMPEGMGQEEFERICDAVDLDLFSLVQSYEGSVSAEHGIGLLKKNVLHFSRSPIEIALMKDFKRILDPQGLLNPGKIF